MDKKSFPKVLIIGQSFNSNGGGGITLSNLFKGWPLDRIAVASKDIESSGFDYCVNYYEFGYSENRRPWPLNKFQSKKKNGPINVKSKDFFLNGPAGVNESKKQTGLKVFFLNLKHFLGVYPIIYRLRISENFMEWIDEFQPEIVYTQLSNFRILKFTTQLIKSRELPLAIHIMDDWPKTLKEPGLLYYYWKWYLKFNLTKLIQYSKVLLSICPAMSEEYLKRYERNFIPFQNTIDISRFNGYYEKDWKLKDNFTILYAGRIGRGTFNSVLKIAKAVENLGINGFNVLFKIRTSRLPAQYESVLRTHKFTLLDKYLPHEEITMELSEVDSLIIPLDFTDIQFTRLSMPTKVPEFLASGTPIIVFAPKTTALYKYANSFGWGITVADNSVESLENTIKSLYGDLKLRKKLGETARKVAIQNHNGEKIRYEFRETLLHAID